MFAKILDIGCLFPVVNALSGGNPPALPMASFIEHPDPVTAGLCTIDQKQVRKAMRRKHAYLLPGPRQWTAPQQTWAAAIPVPVWLISYALLASGITTCAFLLYRGLSVGK